MDVIADINRRDYVELFEAISKGERPAVNKLYIVGFVNPFFPHMGVARGSDTCCIYNMNALYLVMTSRLSTVKSIVFDMENFGHYSHKISPILPQIRCVFILFGPHTRSAIALWQRHRDSRVLVTLLCAGGLGLNTWAWRQVKELLN
jgi:hypothetical protein